jgi:hypothetical protein
LGCCKGLWHGFACFYIPIRALAGRAAVSSGGRHVTVITAGTAVMTAVVITVTLRVGFKALMPCSAHQTL